MDNIDKHHNIDAVDIQCRSGVMSDKISDNEDELDNTITQSLLNKEKILWAAGLLQSAILSYSVELESPKENEIFNMINSRTRKSLNEKKLATFKMSGSAMVDWLIKQSNCIPTRTQAVGVFQVLLEKSLLVLAKECMKDTTHPHIFQDSPSILYSFTKEEPPKLTVIQHQGLLCLYKQPSTTTKKQMSKEKVEMQSNESDALKNETAFAHKRMSNFQGQHSYWNIIKEKRRSLQKHKAVKPPGTWTNLRDLVDYYRHKAHTNGTTTKIDGSNGTIASDKQDGGETKNGNSSNVPIKDSTNWKTDDLDVAINILSHISPDALLKMALSKNPEKRTPDDLELIYQEITHLHALSHLSLMVKRQLVSVIKFESYINAKGTAIITQGDVGMSWYVVLKGTLEVIIDGKGCVGTLKEGDDFGKLALINNSPRTASIILSDNNECLLLRVDKTDFDAILRDVEANTMRLNEHGRDVLILEQSLVSSDDKSGEDISLAKIFSLILDGGKRSDKNENGPAVSIPMGYQAFWFLKPICETQALNNERGLQYPFSKFNISKRVLNKGKSDSTESLAGSYPKSSLNASLNSINSARPHCSWLSNNFKRSQISLTEPSPHKGSCADLKVESNLSVHQNYLRPPLNLMQLGKCLFDKNYHFKCGTTLNDENGVNRSLNCLDVASPLNKQASTSAAFSRWSNTGLHCIYENGTTPAWKPYADSKSKGSPIVKNNKPLNEYKIKDPKDKFYKYFVVAGTPEKMLEYLLETKLAGLLPIKHPLTSTEQNSIPPKTALLNNCDSISTSKDKSPDKFNATNAVSLSKVCQQRRRQFSLLRSISLNTKNEPPQSDPTPMSKNQYQPNRNEGKVADVTKRLSILPARKDTFIQDFILVYAIFLNSDQLCTLLYKYYNIDATYNKARSRSTTIYKDVFETCDSIESLISAPSLKTNKLQVIYFVMEWFTLSATLPFIYQQSVSKGYCLNKILEFAEKMFTDVEMCIKGTTTSDSKSNLLCEKSTPNYIMFSGYNVSEKDFQTYYYSQLFLKNYLINYVKWYNNLYCQITWGPPLVKVVILKPTSFLSDCNKPMQSTHGRLSILTQVPVKLLDKVNLKIYRDNHSHLPYTLILGTTAGTVAQNLAHTILDSIINFSSRHSHSPISAISMRHRIEKALTLESSTGSAADNKKSKLSFMPSRKLSMGEESQGFLASLGTLFSGLSSPAMTCKSAAPLNKINYIKNPSQTYPEAVNDTEVKSLACEARSRSDSNRNTTDAYKLIEVKSNGSTVAFDNGDINFVSRLSCNGRLFILNAKDGEKMEVLSEQLGPFVGTYHELENMNTKEMALYITLYDWNLFKCIIPAELYGKTIPALKHKILTFNLDLFLTQFVIIQHWVCTELCLIPITHIGKRVHLLKKFIKLAFYCKELQNLNTFFAILMGLTDVCVSRLSTTWEKIPAKLKKIYEDSVLLTDPSRNHRAYRMCLMNMQPPIIPFMPLIMKDMTFIHEGNKTYTDTDLVNFEKMHLIGDILRNFNHYRSKDFDMEYYCGVLGRPLNNGASPFRMSKIMQTGYRPEDYENYIKNLRVIDDHKVLMELSYKIEPRKK